jgi:protein OS-9
MTPNVTAAPKDYLKSKLRGLCFEVTHTQYWYYRFCPFRDLTQFRYEDDRIAAVDTFVLGRERQNVEYYLEGRKVVGIWGSGDICLVTKKPRTTRVEFICDLSVDDDGMVTSVSETEYCNYLVQFHTQHVCGFENATDEDLSEILCVNGSNMGEVVSID